MDNEKDRKIDVTAMQILLVQNRQQTHGWTLIGSGANGLGIQEWQNLLLCEMMEKVGYSLNRVTHIYPENDWLIDCRNKSKLTLF